MKPLVVTVLLAIATVNVFAFDVWQYPEMAEKHSLFFGCFVAESSFEKYFAASYPQFTVDYMLPVGLPFSLGFSASMLDPDFKGGGARLGYHVNLGDENTDLYALYTADLINTTDESHLYFGGRIGVRRRFGQFVCLWIETGYKMRSVQFGVCIKLM